MTSENQLPINDLTKAGLGGAADQLVQQLISKHGQKDALRTLARLTGIYTDAPPTWEQFRTDPHFMGDVLGDRMENGEIVHGLYPTWIDTMRQLYPNPFYSNVREVVLSGAIGIGKTTAAIAGICYDWCRFMYIQDPHNVYKLIKSTPIMIALVSATQGLVGGVVAGQMMDWFMSSPFFRSKMKEAEDLHGGFLFPNKMGIVSGSRSNSFLGRAVPMALIDEANFGIVGNQMMDVYNAIKQRMESRFKTDGKSYPGKIWICSSKTDSGSFVEEYIVKHLQNDPLARIYEYPNWEVLGRAGKLKLSGETFKVFIGDDSKDPFIPVSKDQVIGLDEARFLDVPVEYKQVFSMDLIRALQDLAGVSTNASYRFIPSLELVTKAMDVKNPVTKEVIQLDFFDDNDTLLNYVLLGAIQRDSRPRFLHIDLGLVRDLTGISMVRLDGFTERTTMDPITGRSHSVKRPIFKHELLLAVQSKPGQEVPIFKIKDFIINLRRSGFYIAQVSTDGYQSTNLRQDLTYHGFECKLQSVDRTMDPYIELKQAIMEQRIHLIDHPILKQELLHIQKVGNKIDHPIEGSKDMSDSLAGAIWAAKESLATMASNTTAEDFRAAMIGTSTITNNPYMGILGSGSISTAHTKKYGKLF